MSLLTNKNANIESSNKKYYAYLLLIQLLMLTALTVSVPSVVGFQNNPMFITGVYEPICGTSTSCTVVVSFGNQTMSSNSYQATIAIRGIKEILSFTSGAPAQFTSYIDTKAQTFLSICVSSAFMVNISSIQISYIGVQDQIKALGFYIDEYMWSLGMSITSNTQKFINMDLTSRIGHSLQGDISSTHMQICSFITGYYFQSNYNPNIFTIKIFSSLASRTTYTLYAQNAQTNFYMMIHYVVISTFIFNKTTINNRQSQIIPGQINVSGDISVNPGLSYNLGSNDFFIGFNQLYIFTDPSDPICFNTQIDSFSSQFIFSSNGYGFNLLSFNYFLILWRSCPSISYPYFAYVTEVCYDVYPLVGFFSNIIDERCDRCMYDCHTCTNMSSCDTCSSIDKRQQLWVGFSPQKLRCSPLPGYFNYNYNLLALPCDPNCTNCIDFAQNCISCSDYFYLYQSNTSGVCYPCAYKCFECINQTYCLTCANLFKLSPLNDACLENCTYLCSTCTYVQNIFNVPSLPLQYLQCTLCDVGFHLSNLYPFNCTIICGDGLYFNQYEECDDGNSHGGDGCSTKCKIQIGFYCDNHNLTNTTTACYYQSNITITDLKLQKQPFSNVISISMFITTINVNVLKQIDWRQSVETNIATSDKLGFQVSYTSGGIILKLSFAYDKDITNLIKSLKQLQINLNSTSLNPLSQMFANTPVALSFCPFTSQNQVAISYYSQNVYLTAQICYYLFFIESIMAIILLIFGIIGAKIIAVEMIFMIQSVYFSLLAYNSEVSPTIYSMSQLNLGSIIWTYFTQQTDLNWMRMSKSNAYFQNANLCLFLIAFPLIIATLAYLLKKTILKNRQNILSKIIKLSLGEQLLNSYLLITYPTIVSLTLAFKDTSNIDYPISVLGCLVFCGQLVIFYLFIKFRVFFGLFRSAFYRFQISQYWITIQMSVAIVASVIYALISSFEYINVIIIVMLILQIIFLCKISPFINFEFNSNKRAGVIIFITILNQIVLLLLRIMLTQDSTNTNEIIQYLPALIGLNLLIGLSYSFYCVYFRLKQSYQQFIKFKDQYTQDSKQQVQRKRGKAIQETYMYSMSKTDKEKFNFDQIMMTLNRSQIEKEWRNIDVIWRKNAIMRQKVKDQMKQIKLVNKKKHTCAQTSNLLQNELQSKGEVQKDQINFPTKQNYHLKDAFIQMDQKPLKGQQENEQNSGQMTKQQIQWKNFFLQKPKQKQSYYFQKYDEI